MVEKKLDGLDNEKLEPYDEADSEQKNKFNENIENEIKQQSIKTKKSEPKKGGWGIKKPVAISIVLVIIIALIPASVTVPYQKLENYQESYSEKVANNIQVPYDDIEYYYEKEPFTDTKYTQKALIYNTILSVCSDKVDPSLFNSGKLAKVTYTVNNLDTEGGTFKLWVGFTLSDGNKIGNEVSNYIQPQSSADFTYTADAHIPYCSWNSVTIPTKTITETFTNYRDVQKSRTVTKYRTETQYTDVMKTRPAQRYVTEYMQKNVLMIQKLLGMY